MSVATIRIAVSAATRGCPGRMGAPTHGLRVKNGHSVGADLGESSADLVTETGEVRVQSHGVGNLKSLGQIGEDDACLDHGQQSLP